MFKLYLQSINLLLFLSLFTSCQAQEKSLTNVKPLLYKIDPDAQERIDELWLNNFMDRKLFFGDQNYDPMADIIMTGIKDSDGNLWFGSNQRGLFFYDGKPDKNGKKDFQNFTSRDGLTGNAIWCSFMDRDGNLWFGSKGGVTKFDGKTFNSILIPLSADKKVNVLSIAQDKTGQIWFGTEGEGVYRYDGNKFKQYLRNAIKVESDGFWPNVVSSILSDSKGNLWFGSMSRGGVYKLDVQFLNSSEINNNSFTNYRPSPSGSFVSFSVTGSQGKIKDDMIMKIVEDKKGNILIGSRDNGLFVYDGKMFSQLSTKNGLDNDNIATIFEDHSGNIWLGSDVKEGVIAGGLSKINNNTSNHVESKISKIPVKNIMSQTAVRTIVEDRDGNIWYGTRGAGLWMYDGKELTDFSFFVSRGGGC